METYDRHSGTMYALAFRILGDGSAAEEVLEISFLKWAHREHHGTATPMEDACMLIAMTRTQALERRNQRKVPATADDRRSDLGFQNAFPLLNTPMTNMPSAMTAAWEALTAEQRRMIELVYFEGLSLVEIAQRLRQPVPEAQRSVRSSMARLRDVMRSPHAN